MPVEALKETRDPELAVVVWALAEGLVTRKKLAGHWGYTPQALDHWIRGRRGRPAGLFFGLLAVCEPADRARLLDQVAVGYQAGGVVLLAERRALVHLRGAVAAYVRTTSRAA